MNHCLLEVEVLEAPQVRYTQDNQTPVAEMTVRFDGLRPDDPPSQIKVVGWGNLAQDLQNRVQLGARLVLEGRLRMSTVARADGVKEKRAEFTLARLHPLGAGSAGAPSALQPAVSAAAPAGGGRRAPAAAPVPAAGRPAAAGAPPAAAAPASAAAAPPVWNTAPLVPEEAPLEDDDIPF
ncbi:MAG: single-stranded DNA-binding protein [Synechococcaceae cyanobacterium]|nr:single-stranded DNA-binding protein [Synechococcaceae cyanobacterium]